MRVFTALLLAFSLFANVAAAQSIGLPSTDPENPTIDLEALTPQSVRDIVSGMSDQNVRQLLLERLDAVAAQNEVAETDQAGIADFIANAINANIEAVSTSVKRIPILWSSQVTALSNFKANYGTQTILQMLGILAMAIIAGLIAERIVIYLTRNMHAFRQTDPVENGTLRETLSFLTKRLCREIVGLIAFFIVARLIGRSLLPPQMLDTGSIIMVNMVVFPRIAVAVMRFLLAPNTPELRLVHTFDDTAKFAVRHTVGLFLLMGFSTFIIQFNAQNGVPIGSSRLGFWLNAAVHVYIVWTAWRHWDGWVAMARGADPEVSPVEERVARAYPGFVIALSVLTWLIVNILTSYHRFDLLQAGAHYFTMGLLIMAPFFDTLVRGLVRHLVPPMRGEGFIAERAYISTKRSYVRMGRVIMFAMIVILIGRIWGLDISNLAAAGVGAQLAGNFIKAMMIVAVGYFLYEFVSLLINRKLAAEMTAAGIDLESEEPGGGEGGGAGGSRLSTVLPLLMSFVKVAIIVVFALLALGNLGLDTTPLLAGAGIFGLAIGFGAQKLVADVVSGVFFLIDDAFRTGEYVEVDGTMGTVENISIRSLQLRHHKGPVHTIPYGEIPKITNYSRDWVIMKLRFTVPFGTDPNKVKKIFKGIGAEMMEVPEFAEDFMQPFKSQGVFDFDDVGMIIRGKFMAKPGKQFTLRKEIYNRVKARFEEAGIEFARREVRVAIPGLDNSAELSEDQKVQIQAAATEAAQQKVEPEPTK